MERGGVGVRKAAGLNDAGRRDDEVVHGVWNGCVVDGVEVADCNQD